MKDKFFVHDDGKTESHILYRPADLAVVSPLPGMISVFLPTPPYFLEDYGLPRGSHLLSGTAVLVDAEQFVHLRRTFRRQAAAEAMHCRRIVSDNTPQPPEKKPPFLARLFGGAA